MRVEAKQRASQLEVQVTQLRRRIGHWPRRGRLVVLRRRRRNPSWGRNGPLTHRRAWSRPPLSAPVPRKSSAGLRRRALP